MNIKLKIIILTSHAVVSLLDPKKKAFFVAKTVAI